MKKKRIILAIVFSLLGIYIFYVFMKNIDLTLEIEKVFNFSLVVISIVTLLYLIANWIRSLRLQYIGKKVSNKSIPISNLFSIIGLQNFFNNIITLRSGEFLYLFLLKRNEIRYQDGLSFLIITRIIDLFTISLLFSICFLLTYIIPIKPLFQETKDIGLIIFICLLVFWMFFFLIVKIDFAKYIKRWNIKSDLLNKIRNFIIDVLFNFSAITKKMFFYTLCYSLLIWLIELSIIYFTIQEWKELNSANFTISYIEVVIAQFMITIIGGIPIYAVAWIGFFEGIVSFSYQYFGFSDIESKSVAFLIHAVSIYLFLFLGAISTIMFVFLKRQSKNIK